MFGDTLLESSSAPRKGKRWPMATAFTAEAMVGGLLVIIPLLSTGVIPVSGMPPSYKPVLRVTVEPPVEQVPSAGSSTSGPTSSVPSSTVVTLGGGNPRICLTCIASDPKPGEDGPSYSPYVGDHNLPRGLADDHGPNVKPSGPKRIISVLSEGQLVNRVEPVYPHIAAVSGIQGLVKLHAIIGRDGRIQSLSAISGHPLLLRAALEAVEQWRYRPYVLNGETVEVETFITVNFKKEMR
ncbi:MAG TPA: energy transducer TonB [Candidatus Angelobacter sp.]